MKYESSHINVLYLDDDEENLLGFETSFSKEFNILVASSVEQATEILQSNSIAVFLVDNKMPDEDGISFVKRIGKLYPNIIYILVTAYADIDTAISAINQNIFYHFIQKPWNYIELKNVINNAIDKYVLEAEKADLVTRLEIALEKEKNANELKNIFLSNISHEIRTPLNGIIGFTEIARNQAVPENVKEFLDIINESGQQLLRTFQAVLDSSMIISNQLKYLEERFDLKELLEEINGKIIAKYDRKHHIILKNNMLSNFYVCSDKHKISCILINLIDNALIYSNFNEVNIDFERLPESGKFILKVINTNSYIDASLHDLIFEPFRQADNSLNRKYSGNGLGLYIVKSYIDFLGADIELTSDKKLTTFSITFDTNC